MKKLATLATAGVVGATAVAAPVALAHSSAAGRRVAATSHARRHPLRHPRWRQALTYRVEGTLSSWTLTENRNGFYSGSLTLTVKHASHAAKGARGSSETYTVTRARVHFGPKASDPPATGSRVALFGTDGTKQHPATAPKIRFIAVHAPAASTTTTTTTTSTATSSTATAS